MEVGTAREPIRMLVTKQKEAGGSSLTNFHSRGIIFSEVSTPSGIKLVQLLLNQEKGEDVQEEEEEEAAAPVQQVPVSKCTICGESFTDKIAFNAHIRFHLKEKLKKRAKLVETDQSSSDTGEFSQQCKKRLDTTETDSKPDSGSSPSSVSNLSRTSMDVSDLDDNFVSSEFSKEMEINRSDLNNDISSILDQIEKDFEGPHIHMPEEDLDTPPDSDSEQTEPWSTPALPGQPEILERAEVQPHNVSTNTDNLFLNKVLDIGQLCGEDGRTNVSADHDYLMSDDRPLLSTTVAGESSRPAISQVNVVKYSSIPANALGLLNQVPGRILIQRSAGDSRILNIFGLGRLNEEAGDLSLHEDKEASTTEDLEQGRGKVPRPRQSSDCSVCGKAITTKNMARHMEKHTGKKKFKCDVCQAAFFQKTHLKNHVMLHDTASSEPVECGECGERFQRRTDHIKHLKSVHSVDSSPPVFCSVCGAQFNELQKFELHKQMHRSSERRELCGVCGEKFPSKSAMITHMHKHTDTLPSRKPFSCNVCHKTFSQKSHLNRHIKSHGGEQDLVCLVCNKQCKNKVELVRHRSSHLSCSLCTSLFDTKVQLHQHLLKCHPQHHHHQPTLNMMSPPSSLDMFDDDIERMRPLSRSSVDVLNSSSPSSVASHLDLMDAEMPQLFSEDSLLESTTERSKHNLSLEDISDSSFFDINHHLDDDILVSDIFASVK